MKRLLIASLVMGLVVGCGGGEEEGGEGAAGDPIPLTVGNWWVMQDTLAKGRDSTVVEDLTTFQGHDAYVVVTYSSYGTDTTYAWYEGDYLYAAVAFDDTDTVALPFIPRNMSEGYHWTIMDTSQMDSAGVYKYEYKIYGDILGQEDVSVPAGDFPGSWKMLHTTIFNLYIMPDTTNPVMGDTARDTFWISIGTGIVKEHAEFQEDSISVLVDYSVQ